MNVPYRKLGGKFSSDLQAYYPSSEHTQEPVRYKALLHTEYFNLESLGVCQC